MAAQSKGSACPHAAAGPLADGGSDDNPKKIRKNGGTTGIYGIILCKTEKFPDGFCTFGTVGFQQHTARHMRLKDSSGEWYTGQPHKKSRKNVIWQKPYAADRSAVIMTNAGSCPIGKNCGFLVS